MSQELPKDYSSQEGGFGVPSYGVTGSDPVSFEQRTELRDPELAHRPLGEVIDRLTAPESVEAQIVEYVDTLRHIDPDSIEAGEIRFAGELMSNAPGRFGRQLFMGSVDVPEIDLVRRGLEDAPRSGAYEYDYPVLSKAETPEASVVVRGDVYARPTDFVFPKEGFDDEALSAGFRELSGLAADGREPGIRATAVVTPDGSVVYIYRDGNVPLSAIASLSQKVRLTHVEVVKADPGEMVQQYREAAYRQKQADIEASEAQPDEHPGATDWQGAVSPTLRRRPRPATPDQRPAFVSWFLIPPS